MTMAQILLRSTDSFVKASTTDEDGVFSGIDMAETERKKLKKKKSSKKKGLTESSNDVDSVLYEDDESKSTKPTSSSLASDSSFELTPTQKLKKTKKKVEKNEVSLTPAKQKTKKNSSSSDDELRVHGIRIMPKYSDIAERIAKREAARNRVRKIGTALDSTQRLAEKETDKTYRLRQSEHSEALKDTKSFDDKLKLFGTNGSGGAPVTPGDHLETAIPKKRPSYLKDDSMKGNKKEQFRSRHSSVSSGDSPRERRGAQKGVVVDRLSAYLSSTDEKEDTKDEGKKKSFLKAKNNRKGEDDDVVMPRLRRGEQSAGSKTRSSSPGNFREAYLKKVNNVENDIEKQGKAAREEDPTTPRSSWGDRSIRRSLTRSASPGTYQGAYLKKVNSSEQEKESPRTAPKRKTSRKLQSGDLQQSGRPSRGEGSQRRSRSASPGKFRNAYLERLNSQKNEEVKKEEARQAEKPSAKPGMGKSKTTATAAMLEQKLNFGPMDMYMGKKKGQTEDTPSAHRRKVDVFATPYNSKKKLGDSDKGQLSSSQGNLKMTLNALNLSTPAVALKKGAPKPKDFKKMFTMEERSFADSVVLLLKNKSKKDKVKKLCDRLEAADGLPKTRRLSMRDNDLVCDIIRAIQNDPDITEIIVDQDVAFTAVSTTLLFQFLSALDMNLHLKKLTLKGCGLGNDILYALATSMETNFVLEELDLSQNLFTSEGLAEFCQSLANSNKTCKKVNLMNQTTPISVASEVDVLDAFGSNKRLTEVKVDFNSEDGKGKLAKIMKRNKERTVKDVNYDKKIVELLTYKAERAEALMEQKKAENEIFEVPDDDWDYLYELSVLFDKYKLKEVVEDENEKAKQKSKPKNADSMSKAEKSKFLFGQFKDILDDSIGCFNSDGSFLTSEFISKYLKQPEDTDELVFDFHGQWKLFKRFPISDPARELIVTKFVDAIVTHPKAKKFMGINMANTGCGDDFLEELADRCLGDDNLLPNLHMLNFETNFINERGCVALSKLIASSSSLKYLQLVRLENQKGLLTSRAEFALARSMFVNRSVVVVSLQFRNLLERSQIHTYISRNVDLMRQARQRHYKKTGTGRKRNDMEIFFDKVAANDKSITEVNLPNNQKIHSLSLEETIKIGKAFAKNTHVKTINLNGCELGDEFAKAMGKSLRKNWTIEKLQLESNAISGTGIRDLFEGLAKNNCLKEVRLHKQSKPIVNADEDALAQILDPNKCLLKLGIDFRTQVAQIKIDRMLKLNDRKKREQNVTSSGATDDNFSYLF